MKKYLLFAGDEYYAAGGWKDFICDAETIDELRVLCAWEKYEFDWELKIDHPKWDRDSPSGQWLHIVDRDTGNIVFAEDSETKRGQAEVVVN
jgi:hypothetical protein